MAHKKAGGSSRNGRDSAGKRLGVKLFGGQAVTAGNIIVTQRGTKMMAGPHVYVGRTHSLHAASRRPREVHAPGRRPGACLGRADRPGGRVIRPTAAARGYGGLSAPVSFSGHPDCPDHEIPGRSQGLGEGR